MDIEEIIAKKTEQFWNSRFAEGMTQGERNKAVATARNFRMMGFPVEQIALGTGLSVEEVAAL